jgi:hypothetical protein
MAHPRTAPLSFLFYSVLYRHDLYQESEIKKIIEKENENGLEISFKHDFFPMREYYSQEMGSIEHLSRIFFLSPHLVKRQKLVSAKHFAYQLEQNSLKSALNSQRTINIDPGLITIENVVLATFKNFSHRIEIAENIFAELVYTAKDQQFELLPWTYPDYAHLEIKKFFDFSRQLLKQMISANKKT